MYMTIFKTRYGYRIRAGEFPQIHFIGGYSRKAAIKKYREKYNLKYKRLTILE